MTIASKDKKAVSEGACSSVISFNIKGRSAQLPLVLVNVVAGDVIKRVVFIVNASDKEAFLTLIVCQCWIIFNHVIICSLSHCKFAWLGTNCEHSALGRPILHLENQLISHLAGVP